MTLRSSNFDTDQRFALMRTFLLTVAMSTVAASAMAQGHGGPPQGGMGPRESGQKGQADGGFGRNLMNNTTRPAPTPSLESQGGLQLGPPDAGGTTRILPATLDSTHCSRSIWTTFSVRTGRRC